MSHVKAKYPKARYVGIADGAKGNWEFLKRHTDVQVVDFWHAVEYLEKAATVLLPEVRTPTREAWMDESCHQARPTSLGGAASDLEAIGSGPHRRFAPGPRRTRMYNGRSLISPNQVEVRTNGR